MARSATRDQRHATVFRNAAHRLAAGPFVWADRLVARVGNRDLFDRASAAALDTSVLQIIGMGGLPDALVSGGVITPPSQAVLAAPQAQRCSRGENLSRAGTVTNDDDQARANRS